MFTVELAAAEKEQPAIALLSTRCGGASKFTSLIGLPLRAIHVFSWHFLPLFLFSSSASSSSSLSLMNHACPHSAVRITNSGKTAATVWSKRCTIHWMNVGFCLHGTM